MTAETQQPLAGQRVWLTRPEHQAAAWTAELEAAGARVQNQPLIDIVPPEDERAARHALAEAERADLVIATSPNAVRAAWRLRPELAPAGGLLAVGDATGQALRRAAGQAVRVPGSADTSEGLLDMSELANPAGLSIVLLSGEGGRRKLQQTLGERGAQVRKIALYRRQMVDIDCRRLAELVTGNDAAVVTSGEALLHLCSMLESCDRDGMRCGLAALQLVVPSPRVVQLTPEDLFQRPPRVAARMTVEAVISALAGANTAPENKHF